jgi:hypothetical protein
MTPSSQTTGSPGIPGRFKRDPGSGKLALDPEDVEQGIVHELTGVELAE